MHQLPTLARYLCALCYAFDGMTSSVPASSACEPEHPADFDMQCCFVQKHTAQLSILQGVASAQLCVSMHMLRLQPRTCHWSLARSTYNSSMRLKSRKDPSHLISSNCSKTHSVGETGSLTPDQVNSPTEHVFCGHPRNFLAYELCLGQTCISPFS